MIRKKAAGLKFTLAEMLIVLMLIALVAGAVSINLRKSLNAQKFWSDVGSLTTHMQLAQDLMLIAGADVHFKIETSVDQKGISYWIETDHPFPKSFESFIKKRKILKAVHHVAYPESKGGLIDLKFLSKGSTVPNGNLQLSTRVGKRVDLIANINLKGYPGPIYSSEKLEENESTAHDAYLTQGVVQEIQRIQNEKRQPNPPNPT